ncbi:MAG TPA: UbiA-like polyprenyltransferase [candidate division Zixibacteria bacterium]|nr:UbiA-like polyprenyltransferase [candidate division Zixibacteria bacterium]
MSHTRSQSLHDESASGPATGLWSTTASFGSLVKIEHTIFSLPFAALGMALAADGLPSLKTVALIGVALVAARTAAMAFNRLVDRRFDRANPRTQSRELVTGKLSVAKTVALVTIAVAVFITAAFLLNTLCGVLSFPTLVVILGYSYTKRFTALSHLALGLALGISPGAAWLAVGAPLGWTPILLGLIVLTWVAGFDVLYSLADEGFDREHNLRSIPQALGVERAIIVSRLLHIICAVLMLLLYFHLRLPWWSAFLLAPTYALFVRQHSLVSADDLSRLDVAFFTVNGWLGVVFCALTAGVYFLV